MAWNRLAARTGSAVLWRLEAFGVGGDLESFKKWKSAVPSRPLKAPNLGRHGFKPPYPAPTNHTLRHPTYHPIETIRPLIEVHRGVLDDTSTYQKPSVARGPFIRKSVRKRREIDWRLALPSPTKTMFFVGCL